MDEGDIIMLEASMMDDLQENTRSDIIISSRIGARRGALTLK
jgi:hypothetical protein